MQALSIIVRIGGELCEGFGAQTRRKDRYNAFQTRVILGLLCLTLAAKASNLTTKTREIGYVKAASCRINSVSILGIYKENEWKI